MILILSTTLPINAASMDTILFPIQSKAVLVYEQPNIVTTISSMPVYILVLLGGVMAAIAIIVLVKTRK
ncbi:MAG: hypothetical protein ACE5KA_00185 [Nitrososphaerales archaeon]